MPARVKKLIGAFAILIWIAVYALVVARLAVDILPDAHWLVELLFHALAGTLWIIPVGLMLPWMHREPKG